MPVTPSGAKEKPSTMRFPSRSVMRVCVMGLKLPVSNHESSHLVDGDLPAASQRWRMRMRPCSKRISRVQMSIGMLLSPDWM